MTPRATKNDTTRLARDRIGCRKFARFGVCRARAKPHSGDRDCWRKSVAVPAPCRSRVLEAKAMMKQLRKTTQEEAPVPTLPLSETKGQSPKVFRGLYRQGVERGTAARPVFQVNDGRRRTVWRGRQWTKRSCRRSQEVQSHRHRRSDLYPAENGGINDHRGHLGEGPPPSSATRFELGSAV